MVNATCKNLLYLPISILSLQHYDVFDVEGWVVGVVVRASRYYTANQSVGQPKGILTSNVLSPLTTACSMFDYICQKLKPKFH